MPRLSLLTVVSLALVTLVACARKRGPSGPRVMPTPTVQVGACAVPERDGVMSSSPRLDNADRDLDGDGTPERIVVDRAMCTDDGNCYWNVFVASGACARYAGTFEAAGLELLASKGERGMADVRGYWNLHGGRRLLQSYRFVRGGYQIIDAVQCRQATDDRLECMDAR